MSRTQLFTYRVSMRRTGSDPRTWRQVVSLTLSGLALALLSGGFLIAQNVVQAKIMTRGVILERSQDAFTLREYQGRDIPVRFSESTEIEEQKKNILRGAKDYTPEELIPGLDVSVEGIEQGGEIVADEIKFTQDALKVARALHTKVQPIEQDLDNTRTDLESVKTRLVGQEEKDAQFSGEVDELKSGLRLTRSQLITTEDSAKSAQNSAKLAIDGVDAANERISSLDSYAVAEIVTVKFAFDSSDLSEEAKAKLDKVMEGTKGISGYLVEVRGFASADGDQVYNRRLSERRADSVRNYLIETHEVPMRRLLSPFGYGILQPVADNTTTEGRQENRRVEVRVMINRGLHPTSDTMSAATGSPNPIQ